MDGPRLEPVYYEGEGWAEISFSPDLTLLQ